MSQGQTNKVVLPAILDLNAAGELSELLRHALTDHAAVSIDASAVEVLTVPCIQILLAAAKDGGLHVLSPSGEFLSAFHDLSLQGPPAAVATESDEPPVPAVEPQPVEDTPEPSAQEAEVSLAKRILTIDDSKTMRDMLMLTLSGAGYEVIQGVDGQDGLDVLGDQTVDVVITDINMPRMDGYEVIRELRKKPHLDRTPILVLTTESETDKRKLAREAGATGWMVKPFDPERLIATVRKVSPDAAAVVQEPVQ